MKAFKSYMKLTTLVLSFVYTNVVFADDPVQEASNDNATADTISSTAANDESKSKTAPAIEAQTKTVDSEQQTEQPQTMTNAQSYRQKMDERRRQMQQAQLEAYKRHLERRKQYFANNPVPAYGNQGFDNNVPADIQQRRDEFIKQMEERRAMNVKMMQQHRKEAEQRRKAMRLKMHQTCTPESLQKA
ncbi:MAG: hypothetical protein KJN89_09090 [Gammaproteobacteria bacterium]|nr:hypothetical protein [Gammaproteobacteria bacterium]MBT8133221.1 hypothetical protein [Gammaproteobacteria bacterium]NNJ50518.1 hypothetical protein [Gammaproteobacteria bacterium]